MTLEWWLQTVKDGGSIAAVLLLGAVIWLNIDRNRLIEENKEKDEKLGDLAERTIVIMTEIRTFLFNMRDR